jgi:chromate transporter
VLLGAPFMERLRQRSVLNGALTAIPAAVVGVISHLALWCALHPLFAERRPVGWGAVSMDLPVWGSAVGPSWILSALALAVVCGA